jgi:hypothetical protein
MNCQIEYLRRDDDEVCCGKVRQADRIDPANGAED